MGMSGEFTRHPPLSLLYVASGLVKAGFRVELLDVRLHPHDWTARLDALLGPDVVMVGLTVMSGTPIVSAIQVSERVKAWRGGDARGRGRDLPGSGALTASGDLPATEHGDGAPTGAVVSGSGRQDRPVGQAPDLERRSIPVVWGGAHPTVAPAQTLAEPFIDFVVVGSGVAAAVRLAEALAASPEFPSAPLPPPAVLAGIPGLGYTHDGKTFINERFRGFEHVPYPDLPYQLIPDLEAYGQIGSRERIMPIYSAYGCPYQCAFCVSPALYRGFAPKWVPVPVAEVADHIAFLKERWGVTQVYFYDDDSFVKIDHIRGLIGEMRRRNLTIRMSFRGLRVDEVLRMDDAFLDDLAACGTQMLHIGVESGSQRILDLFRKGITVADILTANRKLARNRRVIAAYNWILGTPTETMADIAATRKLVARLIAENPRCLVFQPNRFRPIPGTELGDLAVRHGYRFPERLRDWAEIEVERGGADPWYTPRQTEQIRMLQLTSYFIDRKAELVLETDEWKTRVIRLLVALYRPIARFRFRYGIAAGLLEYLPYQAAVRAFQKE